MREVTTDYESHDPWLFARFVSGRLDVLQLDGPPGDPSAFDGYLTGVRTALSVALSRHAAERLRHIMEHYAPPSGEPNREAAVAFAQVQLESARGLQPRPSRRWFPEQADGRDATAYVHVSVAGSNLAILEAPPHLFDDKIAAGMAIREAINLALQRLEDDIVQFAARATEEPPPPDWAKLAEQAAKLS